VKLDKAKNVVVMLTKQGITEYSTFPAEVQPLEPTATCFTQEGPPHCSMPCTSTTDCSKCSETLSVPRGSTLRLRRGRDSL
jgi:hypothetical protein